MIGIEVDFPLQGPPVTQTRQIGHAGIRLSVVWCVKAACVRIPPSAEW